MGYQQKPKAEADDVDYSGYQQKPNLIIVLLYIERILSFLLRHKMYVLKVCTNSFFSSGSLSLVSFT